MKRRSFLDVLGLGSLPVADGVTGGADPGGTGGFPTLVATADEVPVPDISIEVDVHRQFSESAPARIEIALTSVSDSASGFRFGPTPPFSRYVSTDGGVPTLALVPVPDDPRRSSARTGPHASDPNDTGTRPVAGPAEQVDGCWTLAGELPRDGGSTVMDLSVGKAVRVSREYDVVNYPGNDRCLPRGEYRFVAESYFDDGTAWGFTLELE